MKLSHIAMIIFLASLVLFVPLARPPAEHNLKPFEPLSIVVNVQNSVLIIQSNVENRPIDMIITYLDPNDGTITTISDTPLTGEREFNVENRGFYYIDFFPEFLATITIITEQIPDATIIIVSLTMMVAIGFQIQKQFSRSFDY